MSLENVGAAIKRLRTRRNLSLRELGESLNINYSHLSKVERGIKTPSLELLESIAEYFGVPLSAFFGEEKEVPDMLKEKGVEWIAFGEEMENKDLTPERIKEILDFVEQLKKMS